MSIIPRNVDIMNDVLSGKDYTACAKKFNISTASVSNSIRAVLVLLKEHTDIDVLDSSSYSYVMEKQKEIKKALTRPFPKTSITPSAKAYLKSKFGKYFAGEPATIVTEWETVYKAFNRFTERRDIVSIQNWLASEGFLVGNVLTETMLDFSWDAIQNGLSSIAVEQGESAFTVTHVERTGWATKLVMHAEIGEKDHKVTRKFSIDLMPN